MANLLPQKSGLFSSKRNVCMQNSNCFFLYIDEAVRQINFWTWAGSENQHTNIKAVIIYIRNNLVPLEMRNRETMLGSFISKS